MEKEESIKEIDIEWVKAHGFRRYGSDYVYRKEVGDGVILLVRFNTLSTDVVIRSYGFEYITAVKSRYDMVMFYRLLSGKNLEV